MTSIFKTYRKDFRDNLKLAWPIIAGQVGQVSVHVVDNIMVGQLGAQQLAAISLGVAVYTVFLVVGLGLAFALPPLVAEADGKNDRSKVASFFQHSLIINLAYAVISIVVVLAGLPLLYRLGQEEAVVIHMIPYLRYCMYSMIPFMIFMSFKSLSEGLSRTIPPMVATLVGNVVNIALNYVLIYGKLGFPEMGVGGAGMASFISRICMLALLVVLVLRISRIWEFVRPLFRIPVNWLMARRIFKLGVPTSLQMFFEIGVFSGSTIMMGIISAEAQAAHQIALSLITISFMFCYGLGVSATIRVGNGLGADDKSAMRTAGISAMIQAAIFMLLAAFVFVVFRNVLPLIYIQDEGVVQITAGLLILAALFQVSDGLQVTAIGALRGLQDVNYPTYVTFFAYIVVGFSVAYLAAFKFELGPMGIWIGLLSGLTMSAVFNALRFYRKTV